MEPFSNKNFLLRIRFYVVVLISLLSIIVDNYFHISLYIHIYADTITSPIYFLIYNCCQATDRIFSFLKSYPKLEKENNLLKHELIIKNSDLLLLNYYKREIAYLKKILSSPLKFDERKILAQVIFSNMDINRNSLLVNKGSIQGIYEGQPVVNDKGVVGQIISVSKFTSRLLLISDSSHALPVQILRNSIRFILEGNGYDKDLQAKNLSRDIDIKVGDILVTSGLGDCFPEGYPVAVVSSVISDARRLSVTIQAHPTAELQKLHYLLLVWKNKYENITHSPKFVHQVASDRLLRLASSVFHITT